MPIENLIQAAPPILSKEQVALYQEQGFIHLNQVFSPDDIDAIEKVITAAVEKYNTQHLPLSERDTYGKAFLQVLNLWRYDEAVRTIVFSRKLANLATQLMETNGVRLYHDQALYKEPGGGITPWHADQYYWPLASDKCVTAWIPLQDTPLPMGPLAFSAGSHSITEGRSLPISDESQQMIENLLEQHKLPTVTKPFAIGDVSFHAGWTYHRAGANTTQQMRKVMTVIYMDSNMRLKRPENANQQADWDAWCPGAAIGDIIDTPLNPVIFQK